MLAACAASHSAAARPAGARVTADQSAPGRGDPSLTRRQGRTGGRGLTRERIDEIVTLVRRRMDEDLGLRLRRRTLVYLMTVEEMRFYLGREPDDGLGLTLARTRLTTNPYEIYMVRVRRRSQALRILAHELGHVYYEENHTVFKRRVLREGFSEWVAYRLLGLEGHRREREGMIRRDDLYGRGLRLMIEAEARGGVPAVIDEAMR